jgi:hypothetical protein
MIRQPSAVLAAICLTLFALPTCALAAAAAPTVEWIRQFGTADYENSANLSADILGNVFVAGQTFGNFSGGPATMSTAFLRRYSSGGAPSWTRQVGPLESGVPAVAADGLGNVYLAGETNGNIGGPNAGVTDVFLRKYDSSGAVLWTRQDGSLGYDVPRDAVVDPVGNLYLVGYTGWDLAGAPLGNYDAFLIKYDALGNKLWSRQFGSPNEDYGEGVATDGVGNIYIAGYTSGDVGGPYAGGSYDMFLAKYDASGNAVWKRQLGTSSWDSAYDVAADALGNVYLIGYSEGTMQPGAPGDGDVVLTRFDSAGNAIWTRQFGTPQHQDISFAASTDGIGNVYLGGVTGGSLGAPTAGSLDTFALKYLADGTLGWAYQIGSSQNEFNGKLSHDGLGNLYLTGTTEGALGPTPAGSADAFLVKLHDTTFVPEPSSLMLACIALLIAFRSRRGFGR